MGTKDSIVGQVVVVVDSPAVPHSFGAYMCAVMGAVVDHMRTEGRRIVVVAVGTPDCHHIISSDYLWLSR